MMTRSIVALPAIAALAFVVVPTTGCTIEECPQKDTTIHVPGEECTVGRCVRWRTGPCEETCAAFLEGGRTNQEVLSCTPATPDGTGRFGITCRHRSSGTCTKGPMKLGSTREPSTSRTAGEG